MAASLGHRLCVKRYPTCYFMHRSFDATAKMLEGRNIMPEEVDKVTVTMDRGQMAVLVNERPQTDNEAKFSEQFAMAAAVILGKMGIDELRDNVVQRPDIQAFFPKVTVVAVDEYDERDPAHSPSERVVIRLKDGRRSTQARFALCAAMPSIRSPRTSSGRSSANARPGRTRQPRRARCSTAPRRSGAEVDVGSSDRRKPVRRSGRDRPRGASVGAARERACLRAPLSRRRAAASPGATSRLPCAGSPPAQPA